MKFQNFLVLCLLISANAMAQNGIPKHVLTKDSIINSYTKLGLGVHIIDRSGKDLGFYDSDQSWHINGSSWRASYGKYYDNNFGLEVVGSFGRFTGVNDALNDKTFFGLDLHGIYNLQEDLGLNQWLDPFLGLGAGYSEFDKIAKFSLNTTVGLRLWITQRIGVELSTNGKWAINKDATNYMQHAAGLVYRFKMKKSLSVEAEEALEKLKIFEKENRRKHDSISDSERLEALEDIAEDAAVLAAEKEKEKEALAKETRRKDEIKKSITNSGLVYFEFDGIELDKASKDVLEKLARVLQNHPEVQLGVFAYADSRGTDAYNLALSQKRAQKVANYLTQLGIPSNRITAKGKGETSILNECTNSVACSAAAHKINRRTEFVVIQF